VEVLVQLERVMILPMRHILVLNQLQGLFAGVSILEQELIAGIDSQV
jgi:hypothetical protein